MQVKGRTTSRIAIAGAALASALAALLLAPTLGRAVIHPAQVIAGPSNDIIEVAGAAMAPDGSGGVLYRAREDGIPHVYVVPFANGQWREPMQVDTEDSYGASQTAIAAAEGGRLLVVWVQPRNVSESGVTLYELQSASLAPGASGFGQPITVDPNVGEPYTGDASHVEPKLAMAPDGAAYVVYRVVTDDCGSADAANPTYTECPPNHSHLLMQVRVARYDYLLWSSMGTVNRATQVPMAKPTAANAPTIGIGVENDGVVAWQEPADSGEPSRIWARRLFGTVKGTVLTASSESIDGKPVSTEAETPEIAVSRFGEAKLAYRIDGGKGSAVPTTQLFLNSLPSSFDPKGAEFEGPLAISGASSSSLGVPSASVDPSGNFRLTWSQGGEVKLLGGSIQGVGAPAGIGATSGSAMTTVNPSGGGTSAWNATVDGRPVVEVREDYSGGAYQEATLAGNTPGPISGLGLAGSGTGDALTAWMQGPAGQSEIVGDFTQAPPSTLVVSGPSGWVRPQGAIVTWEPVEDAVQGVEYSVYVDGRLVMSKLHATEANLRSATLGNGVHQVQVLAIDSAGQRTMSAKTPLKLDVSPPALKAKLIDDRAGVRVEVTDNASGVDVAATRISFGDGTQVSGHARATHVYPHGGLYTITARVRDNVGVGATVHIRVRVS